MTVHIKTPESPPLRGVIFDIDGVIFDSKETNTSYYNKILEELGLAPMSAEDVEYCHMASGKQALERIVPPHLRDKELTKAQKAVPYFDYVLPKLVLEDGLMETLIWLAEQNIHLGICTNRLTRVPELLQHFGIGHFFSTIKTASNADPKPSPKGLLATVSEWEITSTQSLFIGDTQADQQAALGAAMPFWAFGNPQLVAERHFHEFASVLKALTPLVG